MEPVWEPLCTRRRTTARTTHRRFVYCRNCEGRRAKKKPGNEPGPRIRSEALAADGVHSLAFALEGLHAQTHLLAQMAADETAHAVSLPTGRPHDGLQTSSSLPANRLLAARRRKR